MIPVLWFPSFVRQTARIAQGTADFDQARRDRKAAKVAARKLRGPGVLGRIQLAVEQGKVETDARADAKAAERALHPPVGFWANERAKWREAITGRK